VLEVCRVGCRRDGHGVGKAFVSDNQLAFMIASQKSPQQSRNIFSFGRDRKGVVRAGSNSRATNNELRQRPCLIKPGYLRGGQFQRRETDNDWLAISRASFNFKSYLSALNSFKRERTTSFTDSTANGRIL